MTDTKKALEALDRIFDTLKAHKMRTHDFDYEIIHAALTNNPATSSAADSSGTNASMKQHADPMDAQGGDAVDDRIDGLMQIIESQKQTEQVLIKRIQTAMRHMEIVSPDAYHLSGVWNILNGGKK